MFYDRGRTDSFDVPAGFGLGYLYHGSVSGVGICVILLLNRKQKKPGRSILVLVYAELMLFLLCRILNRMYIHTFSLLRLLF